MTVAMVVGQNYRCIVACYIGNQVSLNRFDYSPLSVSSGAPATVADLAQAVDNIAAPLYKALLANTATYYGVKAVQFAPRSLTAPDVSTLNTGVGTAGANAQSTQTCGLIRKVSILYGRGRNGRIYVPFPASTDTTAGAPSTGYLTRLTSLAAGLLTSGLAVSVGGRTASMEPIIQFSKPPHAIGFGVLSTSRNDPVWATQYRRSAFGRANTIPPF